MDYEVPQDQDWDDESEVDNHFVLTLYIAGASVNSSRAVVNLKEICETYLKDNYTLKIIDVHQEKSLASREQLIALPLLIKSRPLPERRLIGDMSETEKVLRGLGISVE